MSARKIILLRTPRSTNGDAVAALLARLVGGHSGLAVDSQDEPLVLQIAPDAAMPPALTGREFDVRPVILAQDGRAVLYDTLVRAPSETVISALLSGKMCCPGYDPFNTEVLSLRIEDLRNEDVCRKLLKQVGGDLASAPELQTVAAQCKSWDLSIPARLAFDALCGEVNEACGYARDRFTLAEMAEYSADLLLGVASAGASAEIMVALSKRVPSGKVVITVNSPLRSLIDSHRILRVGARLFRAVMRKLRSPWKK